MAVQADMAGLAGAVEADEEGNVTARVVFGSAYEGPPGCVHGGSLAYGRWPALPLPEEVDVAAALALLAGREDVYDYAPEPDLDGAVEWQVNFADPHLFVAYSGPLFAQDEMQVSEHPALGALREALLAEGLQPMTVKGGRRTPIHVKGVDRRCRVATGPSPEEGRPRGLYGNAFGQAAVATDLRDAA